MAGLTYSRTQEYLLTLVPPRTPEMRQMERYAARTGFPIIGPAAGQFCYQVARQIRARSVFELGSGYGYSTAWFARAVRENGGGTVHHVVWDERLSNMARRHLQRLGYGRIISYHVSEAVQTLKKHRGTFDLIFSDIEKADYPESLPVIKAKLRKGGVLIVDNILWSGRIFNANDRSAETRGILRFTKLITEDHDWLTTLVPIRDGLIVAYRVR
jgi:caffeoyl-CoA O-methyltransferase